MWCPALIETLAKVHRNIYNDCIFLSFCSGSLAYLTAATHGLAEECQEIKDTFDLDPEAVSKV